MPMTDPFDHSTLRTVTTGLRLTLIDRLMKVRWAYFVRQPVGRFAQSVAYIRRLCSANGLVESESFAQTIRGDPATTAPGCVFLLSKL